MNTQEDIKKLEISYVDIGGCEGCSGSILRALIQNDSIKLYTKYMGNFQVKENGILIVGGSICLNDKEKVEELKEYRKKSKLIIAFGSCASLGGITRYCRGGQQPKPQHITFQPINSVIKVDYSIPGCPPPTQFLTPFIKSLVSGKKNIFTDIFKALANIKKLSGFDLIDDIVLQNICIGCGACVLSCPTNALKMINQRPDLIAEKCIRCGTCYVRCPKADQILLGGKK